MKQINVFEDKLSYKPWGDVDKSELIKFVIDNPDKAKDIFLKIDKNWQEDPYNRLSYPIADKNGTVYRYGLSSALAYAKANNETEVINKVEKLYKEYNIQEETDMIKVIEAVVSEEFNPGDKVQIHNDIDGWFGEYEIIRKATDKDYSSLNQNYIKSYKGTKYVIKNNHPGIFKGELTIVNEPNIRKSTK